MTFSGAKTDPSLLDEGNEHLWELFMEVYSIKPGRPEQISFQELWAYQQVTGFRLNPTEVKAIRMISRALVEELSKKSNRQASGGKEAPPLKRVVDMTDTEGLKSLFRR